MSEKILVTGATGNVGRHVVAGLLERGADARALTRDPSKITTAAVRGDLSDPASLDAALDGVDRVFLLWPFMTADGITAVAEKLKGVEHVVYLSAMSVRDDRDPAENGIWGQVEQALTALGIQTTFLRAGGFATNTLTWAGQIRDGVVRWPYGKAARSLIHERDIADVAVRALTEDGHVGAKYVLTGPEAVSQAEQVRLIGEAIGREVRWEELSREVAREQLLAAWGQPSFVDGALDHWAALEKNSEPVTHTVQEVTGQAARTFRQWAVDHADDFR